HLMSAPETFKIMTLQLSRGAPALGRTQHDHGPARPLGNAAGSALLLMGSNFCDAVFHRCRHGLVHAFGIRSLNKVGGPAVTAHQVFEFFMADAREQSRVIDLVAV